MFRTSKPLMQYGFTLNYSTFVSLWNKHKCASEFHNVWLNNRYRLSATQHRLTSVFNRLHVWIVLLFKSSFQIYHTNACIRTHFIALAFFFSCKQTTVRTLFYVFSIQYFVILSTKIESIKREMWVIEHMFSCLYANILFQTYYLVHIHIILISCLPASVHLITKAPYISIERPVPLI